jgi:uncharacterized protein (TIGR02246 family)
MKKLLLCLLLLFSSASFAMENPVKTDVENAYHAWCAAIATAKGKPDVVVKFYAPDAILLPTLSPEILVNRQGGLDAYFAGLTSNQNTKCTPGKLITRLYGDIAINTGLYTFSYVDKKGQNQVIPARFTFIYKKQDNGWQIIEQHSSKLP